MSSQSVNVSQTTKSFSRGGFNFKGIVIIALVAVIYQIYISEFVDEEEISFADFSYGLGGLTVGITGLFVAKRYKGSPVFGKTYLALSIGFILLFVGDLIYNYYLYILEEDPYPSVADVVWLGFYFFTGYHLVKNIQYFKKNLGLGSKIGVPVLASIIVAGFAIFTLETFYDDPVVYFTSESYVIASAAILSLAILGATVFKNSVLGIAWFMLVCGIFLYTFADIWYYYLEEIGEYDITHVVNTLWLLSNSFMVYSLYKHKKTI